VKCVRFKMKATAQRGYHQKDQHKQKKKNGTTQSLGSGHALGLREVGDGRREKETQHEPRHPKILKKKNVSAPIKNGVNCQRLQKSKKKKNSIQRKKGGKKRKSSCEQRGWPTWGGKNVEIIPPNDEKKQGN